MDTSVRTWVGARPRSDRPDATCLLIGEVALAHDGSLGMAHAFIDAIAGAGADAVKFQTHLAEHESTPAEPWRVPLPTQDATRYDYWRRTGFTAEGWAALRGHAAERGLAFLSSPFSVAAVELLERIGVTAWKIPSGETGNPALLERIARTGRPVLLSTGMSPMSEVDAAVAVVRGAGVPFAVLQCTSAYPVAPDAVGLNLLETFRARYGCPVGLSDHSGTVYPALAAAALGADVLEVHVTLSREMFGPDVPASVTTAELRLLAEGIRWMETMRAHPVNKDAAAERLSPVRALFTKSVVARRDLAAGTVLDAGDLDLRKPGRGIPAARLTEVIGAVLRRDVRRDEPLAPADIGREG